MDLGRSYARSYPSSSFGYTSTHDAGPLWKGQGSGMGPSQQGTGTLASGVASQDGPGGWHPTVLYLGVLILAEMIAFGFMAKMLR